MNIHVFIDAENVPPAKAIEAYELMKSEHNVYRCDVIAKEGSLSSLYRNRRSKKFRIQNCDYGKNSADLWLTVCIARAIYEEPNVELFAILSNDRDFVPVIKLAVEKKKQVLLLVMPGQYKGIKCILSKVNIDKNYFTLGMLDIEPELEKIKIDNMPKDLKDYYKNNHSGKTIFVKKGEKFLEMPFINGMHMNQFVRLMRYYEIWTKSTKAMTKIPELGLSAKNNRVYYQTEDEMMKDIIK